MGWPLARLFRRRPEDVGETIDGLPPAVAQAGEPQASGPREFTAREALRTSAFWLPSLGHAFSLLVAYAVSVHAITHMKDVGAGVNPPLFAGEVSFLASVPVNCHRPSEADNRR